MVDESFKKAKNSKIVRKKERSSVKGYKLGKLSSSLLEKKNRSHLRITRILPTLSKVDSSLRYD